MAKRTDNQNVTRVIRKLSRTKELIDASRRGGITLVLGAGISVSRGLPNWDSLAQDLWREAFGRRRSPWQTTIEARSPLEVPQFLPIVFELAYKKLGSEQFLKALRAKLYRKEQRWNRRFFESHETLAVLARLIVQEHERGRNRRIERIVTFNADDLLELAVSRLLPPASDAPNRFGLLGSLAVTARRNEAVIRAVARANTVVGRGDGEPIGVYHIHGFLPAGPYYTKYYGDSDLTLVFTDAQYWSTSATALAFANRVMLSALSESRCVFIGLSMTDINLLRWLALRTLEWDRDLDDVQRRAQKIDTTASKVVTKMAMERSMWGFSRHFWIRPRSDDPTGFLSEFLAIRGIHSVELKNWTGPHFQQLMQKCFPEEIPDCTDNRA